MDPKHLKGKMAEVVIAEMFRDMGYTVYWSGMEHIFPGFGKIGKRPRFGKAAIRVRNSPDFLIVKENQATFWIEVKFSDEKPKKNYPYDEALWVYVKPDSIKIRPAYELKNDLKPISIDEFPEFKPYIDIVQHYKNFCKTAFEWVNR